MPRPLLLIHGYSATGLDFTNLYWALVDRKIEVELLNVGNYISLNNEITIEDISEGLQRAISLTELNNSEEFDALVHSTGMLVVRAWLAHQKIAPGKNQRLKQLKHLIGLAPATWGSPAGAQRTDVAGSASEGQQDARTGFSECRKSSARRARTWQQVYLGSGACGPVGTGPLLWHGTGYALCRSIHRQHAVYGDCQCRQRSGHGRDGAMVRMRPKYAQDYAGPDADARPTHKGSREIG